jgi:hypothetical protein
MLLEVRANLGSVRYFESHIRDDSLVEVVIGRYVKVFTTVRGVVILFDVVEDVRRSYVNVTVADEVVNFNFVDVRMEVVNVNSHGNP